MVNQKNVTGNESAVLRQRQVVPSDSSTVDLSNDSTLASSKNEQRKAKFDSLNPLPAPDPAPTQLTTTPISVPMVLAALISIPSNRSCAECRLQLVDSSQIYASFSPSLGQTPAKSYRRQSGIGDFQFNHQSFAPASSPQLSKKRFGDRSHVDPATAVTGILGGHGVFTCEQCARAHRSLGDSICLVKSVKDASIWTATEVQYLSEAGGNLKSWKTYEGFMPTAWKQKRPSNKSNREERLMFVRAKYDALAFLTPPGGSYAPRSWNRILDLNPTMERWTTPDLRNFSKLTLSEAESTRTLSSSTVDEELPNRLVDFFCVLGHKEQLLPSEVRKDLYSVNSPSDLSLQSQIIDCYPAPGSYPDMDFPTHVNSFAFPDGCRVSESQKAPTFFSFVLTSSNGHKLYGGALHIYDETMETVKMKDVLQKSGYTVPLPWWISDPNDPPREYKSKGLPPPKPPSDVLFLPKCLLVISHYPFFQLWRKFLKQLHRVALAEAPLPIERYIANFVCEVPLPPQGKVSVKYGLLSDDTLTISRPPPNELPMANFSYRPLFTSLSVGNILVVFGELLQETKICLCSKHYSLLTPAAEALMSLLFPFEWQGLYVPVLSYPSMVDLLDAPVPFLVGLNATYLAEVGPEKRPHGVVFVDLDRDVVHLGFVEGSQGRSHRPKRRTTPDLPDRDSIKLKQRLDECADTMYIVPASGIKGMITSGNGQMLQNSSREPYAHMVISAELKGSRKRMETLLNADKAYSEEMSSVDGFSSEHGQQLSEHSERMTRSTLHTPTKTGKFPITGGKVLQALRIHKDNLTSLLRTNDEDFDDTDLGPKSLFTMAESATFSATAIRAAFLRFFTSVFNRYDKFVVETGEEAPFRSEAFLVDLNLSPSNRNYVARILETQMFNTFLQERAENPNDAEILFFDESIVAKNNRSKVGNLVKGGKMATPFLSDVSWKIKETFSPASPSNWGLNEGDCYCYNRFPRLNSEMFGNVRPRKVWPNDAQLDIRRREGKTKMHLRRLDMIKRSVAPSTSHSIPTLLAKPDKLSGPRSMEWAIFALAVDLKEQSDAEREELVSSTGSLQSSLSSLHSAVTSFNSSGGISFRPHSHHGSVGLKNRAFVSDVRLEEMKIQREKQVEKRIDERIRSAQDLLLASRRKQGILMVVVVKIQALWRKFVAKGEYIRYRKALSIVQRRLRGPQTSAGAVSKAADTATSNSRVRKYVLAIVMIQRFVRAGLQRRKQNKLQVVLAVQSWWRGKCIRVFLFAWRKAAVAAQAMARGRRVRLGYKLLMNDLARVQALIRGVQIRRKVFNIVQKRKKRYRSQLFTLWQREKTPLSYRSKLWPYLCQPGFFSLRLCSLELERVLENLEIVLPDYPILSIDDTLISEAQSLGCSCSSEWCYLGVKELTDRASGMREHTKWFPGESGDVVQGFHARLTAERLQIYDRLDNTVDKVILSEIYSLFRMTSEEKKKKARILDVLWTNLDNASQSAQTIALLCPELETGSDIKAMALSKKTLKKFRHENTVLTKLDKALWVGPKLDKLMRENLAGVAVACLSRLPDLTIRLYEAEKKRTAAFEKRKLAMTSAHQFKSWPQCRLDLITEIFCRAPSDR